MMKKTYERLHWVYSSRRITALHGKKAWQQAADMTAGAEGLTS